MEEVLKIWEDYILDIYIGLYKGTLEKRMELRCLYGRCTQISSAA